MRRAYTEIPQDIFKELLSDTLPEDARIYAVSIEPKTAAIQIYFYTDKAPDVSEAVPPPYFFCPHAEKKRTK